MQLLITITTKKENRGEQQKNNRRITREDKAYYRLAIIETSLMVHIESSEKLQCHYIIVLKYGFFYEKSLYHAPPGIETFPAGLCLDYSCIMYVGHYSHSVVGLNCHSFAFQSRAPFFGGQEWSWNGLKFQPIDVRNLVV